MNMIKQLYRIFSDFLEIYVPSISFVIVFVTYIIMIVYRYIFSAQINWIYELSMIAFVWTVVLSASYCSRKGDHIMFTMLYDKLPPMGRAVCRICGNLAVVIVMSILLPYTLDAVGFLAIKKSSLLKIPFNIIFAPFIIFNVLTILHHAIAVGKDSAVLFHKKEEKPL